MKRSDGFTMIELLIVIAIIGIIATVGVFNGRRALTGQQENAAINSIRQSAWQGATAASARGQTVVLRLNGRDLVLLLPSTGEVLRTEEMPAGVSTNMGQGPILTFTPPGKIDDASLARARDYWLETSGGRFNLEFSVIGEVRVR